ncbi:hypothetical protein ACO1O0_003538 [Amphichorda felina]
MALLPRYLSARLYPFGRALRRANRLCALLLLPYQLVLLSVVYLYERVFLNDNEMIEKPWPVVIFRVLAHFVHLIFDRSFQATSYTFDRDRLWGAGPWHYYPCALLILSFRVLTWILGRDQLGFHGEACSWLPMPWHDAVLTKLVWFELTGADLGLMWEPLLAVIVPFVYGRWNSRSYTDVDLRGDASLIRLLTLLPGRQADAVRCELRAVNINVANYEALSYSWGGHLVLRRSITVNGRSFLVTDSVLKALRALRHETRPRVLWIDQICINQADSIEKADQVARMRVVYSAAERVIVWLGAAPREPPPIRLEASLHLFESPDEELSPGRRRVLEDLAATVWDLMGRRWWSRVWVVQEVILARHAVFKSGDLEIDMATLQQLISELRQRELGSMPMRAWGLTGFLPFAEGAGVSILMEGHRSVQWLVAVADWFRNSEATDPRDKLYGFLGLVNVLVVPDYSVEAHELLGDITFRCIEELGHLEILGLARGLGGGSLPSWSVQLHVDDKVPPVPLWARSLTLRSEAKPLKPYSASGDTSATAAQADTQHGMLRLQGWRADTVLRCSSRFPWKDEERIPALLEWARVYQRHSPSVSRHYGREFIRTISAGQVDTEHPDVAAAWTEILKAGDKTTKQRTRLEAREFLGKFPWSTIMVVCTSRAFFVTAGGSMGMGPSSVKKGDEVYVFLGSAVPVVTRDGYYGRRLVGQAYVDGLMYLDDSGTNREAVRLEDVELY